MRSVVGFLFFLIGLFVFIRGPAGALRADLLPALRPVPAVLRLPAAARVLLVDRRLRAEHGDGEPLPAAGRLPPLLPRVPAAQAAALRQARRVDRRAAPPMEGQAPGVSLGQPGLCSTCSTPCRPSSSCTTCCARCGAKSVTVLSGAPLSSWVLLGDYLVLGLARAGALGLHARGPARAPPGVPRLRRDDRRHGALSSSSASSFPPPSASTSTPSTGSSR